MINGQSRVAMYEVSENKSMELTGKYNSKIDEKDLIDKPDDVQSKKKSWNRLKLTLEYSFENRYYYLLMATITFYVLYIDDVRLAAMRKPADFGIEVSVSICFFIFLVEIVACSIYKPGYLGLPQWEPREGETQYSTWLRRFRIGSFYFWLDWIATLSLILQLQWILGSTAYNALNGGVSAQSANSGNATQSGTRAARVIRVVRMVRLVRLIKLYKYAAIFKGTKKIGTSEDATAESRVGAAMSDLTNRRVIILILIMIILIPVLNPTDTDTSLVLGIEMVNQLALLNMTNAFQYSAGLNLAIKRVQENLPVILIQFNNTNYYADDSALNTLRDSEITSYYLSANQLITTMSFSGLYDSQQAALYSIYTTSFIIVLLLLGTYFFSSDVNRLVIRPIERLVELVRKISANPLGVEYKVLGEEDGFYAGMETTILLTTITKIGGLMRVGFGEAGASTIAKNLGNSIGGELSLTGSGRMINSIFGFCDVRQFTDTTECLQEEVMLFVNRIAHILHSIVVQCSGAANKNIGDAFLLTWKVSGKLKPDEVSNLADQALLAFCKSLIELSRYQSFICNFSVSATGRLYKRFPEYKVHIGSGLHFGWAIEGAIGSNHKIDASYLSPHVNFTEFLESSTKAYGVALLMSDAFFELLSPEAKKFCRQVDRIRRSAIEAPVGLYTYDADLNIDWNDMNRNKKKITGKARLMAAVKTVTKLQSARNNFKTRERLATIPSNSSAAESTGTSVSTASELNKNESIRFRKSSKDGVTLEIAAANLLTNRRQSAVLTATPGVDTVNNNLEEAEKGKVKPDVSKAPTIVLNKYNLNVWTTDPEIIEMRHLISDDDREKWNLGMEFFLNGEWSAASKLFNEVNSSCKKKDGPSNHLLNIIRQAGGQAPSDWQGYRDESEGGH